MEDSRGHADAIAFVFLSCDTHMYNVHFLVATTCRTAQADTPGDIDAAFCLQDAGVTNLGYENIFRTCAMTFGQQ